MTSCQEQLYKLHHFLATLSFLWFGSEDRSQHAWLEVRSARSVGPSEPLRRGLHLYSFIYYFEHRINQEYIFLHPCICWSGPSVFDYSLIINFVVNYVSNEDADFPCVLISIRVKLNEQKLNGFSFKTSFLLN